MSKSDLVDVTVYQEAETAAAVLVRETFDTPAIWLPKSQIEIETTGKEGVIVVTLPEWLAAKKGLV